VQFSPTILYVVPKLTIFKYTLFVRHQWYHLVWQTEVLRLCCNVFKTSLCNNTQYIHCIRTVYCTPELFVKYPLMVRRNSCVHLCLITWWLFTITYVVHC